MMILLLLPSIALYEHPTPLLSLGFTCRRRLTLNRAQTLINPRCLGHLTSPRIKVRDKDRKYKSSIEISIQ
jgi:hypothetical protein